MKKIIEVTGNVLKQSANNLIKDKSGWIIVGTTLGFITALEAGAILTKREAEEHYENKKPEKSFLKELWEEVGEHYKSMATTMVTCNLITGFNDVVIVPALKKKWPDRY